MEKTGSEINATFVPKELLIRTDLKAVNNIAQKSTEAIT